MEIKECAWNVLESEIINLKESPRRRHDNDSLLQPAENQIPGKRKVKTIEAGRRSGGRGEPNWHDLGDLKVLFPLPTSEAHLAASCHIREIGTTEAFPAVQESEFISEHPPCPQEERKPKASRNHNTFCPQGSWAKLGFSSKSVRQDSE